MSKEATKENAAENSIEKKARPGRPRRLGEGPFSSFNIRIPVDLGAYLFKAAKEAKTSKNEYLLRLLRADMENTEKGKGTDAKE